MTVDAAYIGAISGGEYSVGTTGTISQSTFDLFLAQAVQQATADAPKTVSNSVVFDELVGLQVCYRISRMDRKLDVSGEKLGADVSYSKNAEDSWLVAYDKLLASAKTKSKGAAGASVTHASVDTSIKFDTTDIEV